MVVDGQALRRWTADVFGLWVCERGGVLEEILGWKGGPIGRMGSEVTRVNQLVETSSRYVSPCGGGNPISWDRTARDGCLWAHALVVRGVPL